LTIVQWTFDELSVRLSNFQSAPTVLALSWVHGDRLFSILHSYGWDPSDLIDDFSLTPSRVHSLFQDSIPSDSDVANPHNVSPEAFLVCGLRQSPRNGPGFHLEPELRARLRSLLLLPLDGLRVPRTDLIPDVTAATNHLSSFLGCDRLAAFQDLAELHELQPIVQLRETIQRDAFTLLQADSKDGWTMLKAASGNSPVPEDRIEEVRAALCRADFASDVKQDPAGTSAVVVLASTFLKFVANDDANTQFSQQLVNVARELRRHSTGEEVRVFSARLVEAALNLSRCALTPGNRVSAFASIVADLAFEWPALGLEALPRIQLMCDELPIDQTAEMWRLNLRLRSY
jgi:hypothetical protein